MYIFNSTQFVKYWLGMIEKPLYTFLLTQILTIPELQKYYFNDSATIFRNVKVYILYLFNLSFHYKSSYKSSCTALVEVVLTLRK